MVEIKGTQEEIDNINHVIENYCIEDCKNCFMNGYETCDIDATYKVKDMITNRIGYLGEDVIDKNGKLLMKTNYELSVEQVIDKINEIIDYINKEK